MNTNSKSIGSQSSMDNAFEPLASSFWSSLMDIQVRDVVQMVDGEVLTVEEIRYDLFHGRTQYGHISLHRLLLVDRIIMRPVPV
jgi:hypothetical protein